MVATPNITVYRSPNTTVKAGNFYRPGNGDVFTGIMLTKGSMGQPTKLYPVDTSKIDRTTTFQIKF